MTNQHRGLLFGGFAVLCASGCGYTTERPYPTHVRSVFVEMFQTRDFRKDLEFKLTEALAKRVEMDTDYRLAPRKDADTVLSGEIIEIRQNRLGDDFRTALPREMGVTFVLSFRWKDQRSGKILAERQRSAYTTTYISPVGESFFDGAVRGLDGVAEQVVEALETGW